MLCNDAELFEQDGVWKVEGDPTEGALYPLATKLGMERRSELARLPRIDAIPFESEHKFMATLHQSADGKELLLVKGAPEVILEHCDRQQTAGDERKPIDRAHFMSASDKLAGQGERVLGLAWLERITKSGTPRSHREGPHSSCQRTCGRGCEGSYRGARREIIPAQCLVGQSARRSAPPVRWSAV
jgi:magnesium-transporting ATPase (P-type)